MDRHGTARSGRRGRVRLGLAESGVERTGKAGMERRGAERNGQKFSGEAGKAWEALVGAG